jgi:hypothetical protein
VKDEALAGSHVKSEGSLTFLTPAQSWVAKGVESSLNFNAIAIFEK